MARVPIERVIERLWPAGPDDCAYAIFDGARDPDVVPLLAASRLASRCLYVGDIDPALARVAPHLVRLSRTDARCEAILARAWGAAWGVFCRAQCPMEALHRHFRRFLRVRDEAGRSLLFRYYDPRVLRTYLPTCLAPELAYVFGPVESYVVEDADPACILEFRNRQGVLARSEVRTEARLHWLGDYLRSHRDA